MKRITNSFFTTFKNCKKPQAFFFNQKTKPRHVAHALFTGSILLLLAVFVPCCRAQVDQGSITGVIQDTSGAVIPGAQVRLKNTDTGLVLNATADASGVYIFSPIKIGSYEITASAPGMQSTTQKNVIVELQQRLSVNIKLHPGTVNQTVVVTSAPPLLQTQQASVGQVMSATTINNTPLNGRNWVYIAQLSAGVTSAVGSRGQGSGDFDANGERPEQNNFILDGVDNNVNVVDFMNGASYVVRPPPDALAEFKIDTGDYSAEFGHSAGSVINASIKSGTDNLHGDLWEYLRNNDLDALDWNALDVPPYHENQFGATLGLPIIRNKLFFFGDAEANRIIYAETSTETVPTALMRQGNFSELLDPALTSSGAAIHLYEPNSGGTTPLTCGGNANVLCQSQISTVAQALLKLFPAPNANGAKTYNNYVVNRNVRDNTFQWDTRADWNISAKDQTFARFSYTHEPQFRSPPLGPILDGGPFQNNGNMINLGENFALSETHIFNPGLINEFRFGYNYGSFAFLQENYASDLAPTFGLGGVPFDAALDTGGLPAFTVTGLSNFGTTAYFPTKEGENVYQFLDNLTKDIGNHSLKFGVNIQSIRFRTLQVADPLGAYSYTGEYTSDLNAANTGFGTADFLADQMYTANISTLSQFNNVRWYRSAYAQDDWRATSKLTLNFGLRYDYVQPMRENSGRQANFLPSPVGPGEGSGTYIIPTESESIPLAPAFMTILAKDNIAVQYSSNPFLIQAQKTNFAPRFGFAYTLGNTTVVRGGFGIFFGGLENRGGATNLGNNYPFQFTSNFPAPTCKANNCPSDGLTLESGFSSQLAVGLGNYISTPPLEGYDALLKTPYSMNYNFSIEHSVTTNLAATVDYVGSAARHLQVPLNTDPSGAIVNPSISVQKLRPFPDIANGTFTDALAESNYNALQAKLEKRYADGLNFLATYTFSHSLDDAPTALQSDTGFGNSNTFLIPIAYSYSNSIFDIRQRVTLNGFYELPFGAGRKWLHGGGIEDRILGQWSSSLTFVAQTGSPFTVEPANVTSAGGITALAQMVRNPFAPGGSRDPSNPSISCTTQTRTKQHWYNPCAFANPINGTSIPSNQQITALAQVLQYQGGRRNEIHGPGLMRINMSLFKNFRTFREEQLQFRADAFNLLNTPSYGNPSTANNSNNGGLITAPQTLQNLTPDARFFQLAAKYIF